MADRVIERLDDAHDRGGFDCGQLVLTIFSAPKRVSTSERTSAWTFVAVDPGRKRVLSYYTLALGAVEVAHLPPTAAKKLPKHPAPVVLLGRLAVDRTEQRKGLGGNLTLRRSEPLSRHRGAGRGLRRRSAGDR